MNIVELQDKASIYMLLGCYCNKPQLAIDENLETMAIDYIDTFHKTLWGAITNIAKKGNVTKISAIEIETEIKTFPKSLLLWNLHEGGEYITSAINQTENSIGNVTYYYEQVKKFTILRQLVSELNVNISHIYNPEDDSIMEIFNSSNPSEILNIFESKFNDLKMQFKNNGDNYSFHVGKNVLRRLQQHKNQDNTYGYPFQSSYMTTIYRGMRAGRFLLASSITGGGKSRGGMANAFNISSSKLYDWNKNQWVSTGKSEPCLFISTELTIEEIQDFLLAHVSGIPQDRIEDWNLSKEEERILMLSAIEIKNSKFYGEYLPDFTIDTINSLIQKYVLKNNIKYVFFDYINDAPSLYSYYHKKTKTNLRTDQILFLFSCALKLSATKYNIHLSSGTQSTDNQKDDLGKDSSSLKGSKAIADKIDGGYHMLPATKQDLEKLKPIIDCAGGFGTPTPNTGYFIYKNRGGKWNKVIVWTKLDLGTLREKDCFVTNYNYELIDNIEKTVLTFEFDNPLDSKYGIDDGIKSTYKDDFVEILKREELNNDDYIGLLDDIGIFLFDENELIELKNELMNC